MEQYHFEYAFSAFNCSLTQKFEGEDWISPLTIKNSIEKLVSKYSIIFSLHSKQIFPPELVNQVRCYNVHPGYNPYNRGWYPQVFSIINGLPAGATIHEIDEELDHGRIICQKKVEIFTWDTSLSVYNRILDAEMELLSKWLEPILKGEYEPVKAEEGNINLKSDFNELLELDLQRQDSLENHINLLRALTHGDYDNAYFIDNQGNKVFVRIQLTPEGK
jgi:methionyl-tRNA formyltransferase